MTKNFEQRVITEEIVDTRKYRYIGEDSRDSEGNYQIIIKRTDIDNIGRTAMLDPENWEIVKIIK